MEYLWAAIAAVIGIIIGLLIGFLWRRHVRRIVDRTVSEAETEAKRIVSDAIKDSETKRKEMLVEAKEEILRQKNDADREIKDRRREITNTENRIAKKEEALDRKIEANEKTTESLNKKMRDLDAKNEELSRAIAEQRDALERISGLTVEQAKAELLDSLESEIQHETAMKLDEYERRFKDEAEEKAKNILSLAIQRCAADHVSEVTISSVTLPNDEMKGRIIGREGRNIRTIETLTGVDLIIDDTPEAITLSSFDPVRREVARIAIEKLISDGRRMRGSASRRSNIALLSKMWFPVVMTSAPAAKISAASAGVRPLPPAAFSPLTTVRSGAYFFAAAASSAPSSRTARSPTMSPMASIRICVPRYRNFLPFFSNKRPRGGRPDACSGRTAGEPRGSPTCFLRKKPYFA